MKRLISLLLALFMLMGLANLVSAGYDPQKITPVEGTLNLAPRFPFEDVPYKSWYFSNVWYVNENLLMNGKSDTQFAPLESMTRAQFVTMLFRLCGAEEKITDTFTDVKPKSWCAPYIGWAEEAGIINGITPTTFEPNANMTRAQMATALSRYFEYIGLTLPDAEDAPESFSDTKKIPSWAKQHVETLRKTGLIKGDNKGAFNASNNMNRAEAATLVARIDIATKTLTAPDTEIFGAVSLYTSTYGARGNAEALDESGKTPLLDLNGNKFNIDMRYLFVSPEKHPVVSVVFTGAEGDVSYSFSGGYTGSVTPDKVTVDGSEYSRIVIDLASLIGEDWSSLKDAGGSGLFVASLLSLTFAEGSDVSVLYTAFSKDVEKANSVGDDIIKAALAKNDLKDAFFKEADSATIEKYEKEAQDKIDAIMSAEDIDPATIKGSCYYISSVNGDDSNDGLTPETAWKTVDNLYTIKGGGIVINNNVKDGDGVFFERGSEFFGKKEFKSSAGGLHALQLAPGVTYSAYGEGAKPVFSNRLQTETPTGKWVETEHDNIWRLDEELIAGTPDHNEICAVIVNSEKDPANVMWGIRCAIYDSSYSFSTDRGIVTNGRDVFLNEANFKSLEESLKNDLQFYYDNENAELYMYCDDGNPADVFADIKFSFYGDIITGGGSLDTGLTIVDNLAVKYGARHGMAIGGNNFTAQNCELGWLGGKDIGNGIESWGNTANYTVKDCYMYQCYDDCATVQFMGSNSERSVLVDNVNFIGNVCTDTTCAFEIWSANEVFPGAGMNYLTQNSVIRNTFVKDNYWLRMGYGFGHQRSYEYEPNKGAKFVDCAGFNFQQFINVVIENNVGIHSTQHIHYIQQLKTNEDVRGVETRNNTYVIGNLNTYYSRMFFSNRTDRVLYPYSARTIAYLQSIGIESGSEFYYYDGYLTDVETETGVMH